MSYLVIAYALSIVFVAYCAKYGARIPIIAVFWPVAVPILLLKSEMRRRRNNKRLDHDGDNA
jgi:Flp pilus assembly protein TadB